MQWKYVIPADVHYYYHSCVRYSGCVLSFCWPPEGKVAIELFTGQNWLQASRLPARRKAQKNNKTTCYLS